MLEAVVLIVLGAAVGYVPAYLTQRRSEQAQAKRERDALLRRWDPALSVLCGDFAATVRRYVHLVQRLNRAADRAAQVERIDEQHQQLRALTEQLRLLGDRDVQVRAHSVQKHAYALRVVAEGGVDKRAADYPDKTPDKRVFEALYEFYVAARRQLQVPNPDDVDPQLR